MRNRLCLKTWGTLELSRSILKRTIAGKNQTRLRVFLIVNGNAYVYVFICVATVKLLLLLMLFLRYRHVWCSRYCSRGCTVYNDSRLSQASLKINCVCVCVSFSVELRSLSVIRAPVALNFGAARNTSHGILLHASIPLSAATFLMGGLGESCNIHCRGRFLCTPGAGLHP